MVRSLNTRRRYMYNQDKLTVPCLTNQYDNTWKHQLIHQPSAHLHVNWKRPCAVVLFLPRRDCETADTADLHWGCSDRSCFSNFQCSALQVRDFTGFFPHANFMIFHSSCVTGLKNAQSPKKCMEHDFLFTMHVWYDEDPTNLFTPWRTAWNVSLNRPLPWMLRLRYDSWGVGGWLTQGGLTLLVGDWFRLQLRWSKAITIKNTSSRFA
jgi:hypothetical protein